MPTDSYNHEYNEQFRPMPVADLLTSNYHFIIPSFQRGYRWERKQVEDLLDDIYAFSQNQNKQSKYFLQPLVIKKAGEKWEVLDGQQRLTTMLLILMKVVSKLNEDDKEEFENSLYEITYSIRPELDFKSPDPHKTIDGFYLTEAKQTIERWFEAKKIKHTNLSDFYSCLLYRKTAKQVNFIWYEISAESSEKDSINVFNRLNKGKISLTGSELIKALFVLDIEERDSHDEGIKDESASDQLVMKWNEMEKKFQDDSFWLFISNDTENIQTRLDLLFDFVTEKKDDFDTDYSYRKFQNLYDHSHSGNIDLDPIWQDKGIDSMKKAWKQIKNTYDRIISWFDDNTMFHYIGFLISQGSSPIGINASLQKAKTERLANEPYHEWTREDNEEHLRNLISDKFKSKNNKLKRSEIDKLEYSNSDIVLRLLLLFNIELCIKTGNQRFKFDLFKKENWDIEHVDSQNESCLQKPEDRIHWLSDVCKIMAAEKSESVVAKNILNDSYAILSEVENLPEEEWKFSNESYSAIYKRINQYFSYDPEAGDSSEKDVDLTSKDKDSINNLTLLNSSINRSYKDAPFPYKRYFIINQDKEGSHFIPIGTRNLFMKYYSTDNASAPLQLMRWNERDKISYLKFIHDIVDRFFEE